MKGKKFDSQFFSDFIMSCVKKDISKSEDIAATAQKEIDAINEKIIQAEKLKLRRSKLLDVVATLKEPEKFSEGDNKILEFVKINNPNICKFICSLIKVEPCSIKKINSKQFSTYDINFCIKQLLEHKVIFKVGDIISRGDQFDQYVKFVLR